VAAAISAFQAVDGTLFLERGACEAHDLRAALTQKYGETRALEMDQIVNDLDWLYATLVTVKAATVAHSIPKGPSTHGLVVDPSVEGELDVPYLRLASDG